MTWGGFFFVLFLTVSVTLLFLSLLASLSSSSVCVCVVHYELVEFFPDRLNVICCDCGSRPTEL